MKELWDKSALREGIMRFIMLGVAASTLSIFQASAQEWHEADAAISDMRVSTVVSPSSDAPVTVGIGETVLHVRNRADYNIWVLDEDGRIGALWGKRTIPAGTQIYPMDTKAEFKACVRPDGSGGCFIDDDGDGAFDRWSEDQSQIFFKIKAEKRPKYGKAAGQTDSDFEYIIRFSGADGDTLRFSYREFKSDFARDAFTEELVVPREEFPQMIRIKGHNITVEDVSGMGITYRLTQ
ncbi:hypothetical protein [Altericroceibacterium endophyticum]|uniref:Uncharacterized protein n=1 Tax=Altericroceibacterium endophyticum TaxID=1808508 RepID=A0A6I4T5X9_9SPHN|nr:hypothetical protein [Altericroceibacterium endophyticum]MXO66257.1 hypothetical protein [Altericroceibacterium endophyticum]